MTSAAETAQILVEALPYIQRFRGKTVVVKLGGAAIDAALDRALAQDVLLLRSVGVRCVLVHGGGPQVDAIDEADGQGARIPRRPARHRRGDAQDRAHGAGRRGQPQPRRHDQQGDAGRSGRGRGRRRGWRPARHHAARPGAWALSATSPRSAPSGCTACSTRASPRSSPRSAPILPASPTISMPTRRRWRSRWRWRRRRSSI